MTTIIEQAQQAELALAAYATLSPGVANKNALISAGLSAFQSDQFIGKYSVVDQYNVTDGAAADLNVSDPIDYILFFTTPFIRAVA